MKDDFAATTLDREAMTFDEPVEEPKPRRPAAPGPAWAGTLASMPATAAPPEPAAPPAVVPAPTPPEPVPPPEPTDPSDFAATRLHQRAMPVSLEPPLDELSAHNRILSALPGRQKLSGAPSEAGDRALMIGLVAVGVLIALLAIILLYVAADPMFGPE